MESTFLDQISERVWVVVGFIIFIIIIRLLLIKAAKSFYGNIVRRIKNDPSSLDILIDPDNPERERIIREFSEIQELKKIVPKRSSIPGTQTIEMLTTSNDMGENWYELVLEIRGTQQKIVSMKKIMKAIS